MKKLLLATILWAIGLGHPQAYASSGIEQTAPIFSLPDEVILAIFQHLPPNDLLALTRTSQRLRRIANDQSLWYRVELNVKSWTEAPAIVEKYKHQKITDFYLYREGYYLRLILEENIPKTDLTSITDPIIIKSDHFAYQCIFKPWESTAPVKINNLFTDLKLNELKFGTGEHPYFLAATARLSQYITSNGGVPHKSLSTKIVGKPQDKPRELHLSYFPTLDQIQALEKTRPNTAILVFSPPIHTR